MRQKHVYSYLPFFVFISLAIGCSQSNQVVETPRPRVVGVSTIRDNAPSREQWVAAAVDSWKDQKIGFEVTGRVKHVVERNTVVRGSVFDADGNLLEKGTPIARLDDERFRLKVAKAKADVAKARQDLKVAEVDVEISLPSKLAAATAKQQRAASDVKRSERLLAQRATSQSEAEALVAAQASADAEVLQAKAAIEAQRAKIDSFTVAIEQAEQRLREAERDLEDCVLYSAFDGEITNFAVVPGSYVEVGANVATIRMMDPIRVVFEVDSDDSRRIRPEDRMRVRIRARDGQLRYLDAFVHTIDPVADAKTRTFTVQLLLLNQRIKDASQENLDPNIALAQRWWPLQYPFLPGSDSGALYIDQKAIHQDDQGDFLWQVNNASIETGVPTDRMLQVSKLRIEVQPPAFNYLGNWVFQQIKLADGQPFDPAKQLVAGQLRFDSGLHGDDWNGDTVLLCPLGQWMLRPGAVVEVDLYSNRFTESSEQSAADQFFIPMDALVRSQGKTYVMLAIPKASSNSKLATIAKREVQVLDEQEAPLSTFHRVRFAETFDPAAFVVTSGNHYVTDVETVEVADWAQPRSSETIAGSNQ